MKGLTNPQRDWARRAYSQTTGVLMCHFPIYTEQRGWGFCGSTKEIHIHHVIPKRFFSLVFRTDPNHALNLIALCSKHHVGKGYRESIDWRNDVVYVVHPDIAWAFQNYGKLKREAFEKVFSGREKLAALGKTYWNTDWDEALSTIAHQVVWKYIQQHPEDPFPYK